MSDWYLLRDGKPQGPYPQEQLQAWLAQGAVQPGEMACPVGGTTWQPLGAYPEFASVPAGLPVAPAYVPGGGSVTSNLSRWITAGWNTVKDDWGTWVLATLLLIVISVVSLGICGPPLTVGLYRMVLRKQAGERVQAGDVFEGFQYFAVAWGYTLILTVPVLVLLSPLFAMVILAAVKGDNPERVMQQMQLLLQGASTLIQYGLGTVTLFGLPLIAEQRLGSWEAIKRSWENVRGDFWSYLLVFVIMSFVAGAGFMACGVGMLFSVPLSYACLVAVYRSKFPAVK